MNETKRVRPHVATPSPAYAPSRQTSTDLFFGREGQADELARAARPLALPRGRRHFGQRQVFAHTRGSDSAHRGGMMPGAGAGWRIAVMRPGHDPVGNLARALAEPRRSARKPARWTTTLRRGDYRGDAAARLARRRRRGASGAASRARQAARRRRSVRGAVPLPRRRARTTAAPRTTPRPSSSSCSKPRTSARLPVYVVLTMRSDFLGDCAQFQGLPEAVNDGQYLIPRMTRDERRFAITGPARGRRRGRWRRRSSTDCSTTLATTPTNSRYFSTR